MPSPRSLIRCRQNHTRSLVRVVPGVMVRPENISSMVVQTSWVSAHKRLLFRQPAGDQIDGETLGRPESTGPPGSQRLAHPFELADESPSANAKVRDLSMPITFDSVPLQHLLEHLPLLVTPQLGLVAATPAVPETGLVLRTAS